MQGASRERTDSERNVAGLESEHLSWGLRGILYTDTRTKQALLNAVFAHSKYQPRSLAITGVCVKDCAESRRDSMHWRRRDGRGMQGMSPPPPRVTEPPPSAVAEEAGSPATSAGNEKESKQKKKKKTNNNDKTQNENSNDSHND